MRRRDVGVGIALGSAIVVADIVIGAGTNLHRWMRRSRALGVVGVAWSAFIVGYNLVVGLLLVLLAVSGGGIRP